MTVPAPALPRGGPESLPELVQGGNAREAARSPVYPAGEPRYASGLGERIATVDEATATAALSVGVGFLPVAGAAAHLGPIATGAAVSLLAACAALVQPRAGHALDHHRLTINAGLTAGLAVTAAGLAAAVLPGLTGILLAGVLIGAGTGLITPLGFAALAAASPPERLGQTMGAAELGRELGDAGGPLLVAAVAAATTLTGGFAALAALTRRRNRDLDPAPPPRTAPAGPPALSRRATIMVRSGRVCTYVAAAVAACSSCPQSRRM
ncbi:MFS transporter [Streptomyces sp. NPDC005195]|uniref:MFS transporter n=1 Tax=Streptomyces sp. NPDC005195 TaxID=3154561 RepID=UPI0033AC2ADF